MVAVAVDIPGSGSLSPFRLAVDDVHQALAPANSGDRTVGGMYDAQKLSDEMSVTAVEQARKATCPAGQRSSGR